MTGFWIGWLDLLTPYTFNSKLQAITALPLFPHITVHHYTHGSGFITASLSLQITHEVFFSQPNSFLAIILQMPIPKTRLSSIPLLPSSYPGRLASRNSTLLVSTEIFFITTQKIQPLYCREGVFTASLHSNWSYSIVACVFVAAGMSLAGRCLAMNVYSDFAIRAFGRHVTIFYATKIRD
jgi:hypothetical protein